MYKLRTLLLASDFYQASKQYFFPAPKNSRIDPLCTLLHLAILAKKPSGTKISFSEGRITFQENHTFQGAIRKIHGDNRHDLHLLYEPIQQVCSLPSQIYDFDLIPIYQMALIGLEKLEKTYDDSPVISQCLDHYHQTILNYLSNRIDQSNPSGSISQSIWTENRIRIILGLMDEINQTNDDEYLNYYLRSLELFLVPMSRRHS